MTMPQADNPRAVLGSNTVDPTDDVKARLARDYDALAQNVSDILARARELPAEVIDEESSKVFVELISDMRGLSKRIDGIREAEKEPFLASERAVDQFFFGLMERLGKRKPTDKAGGADVLHMRVHAYNQRRLDEERRVRAEAARVAWVKEQEEAAERRKAEDAQRLAEEAARRARKAQTIEAHQAAAADAARVAAEATDREAAARQSRVEADIAAAAKPADLVRERHSGAMNTMRQVGFAEITDPLLLDKEALWPFIDEKALAKALTGWARVSQFKRHMPGASIGMRDTTAIV